MKTLKLVMQSSPKSSNSSTTSTGGGGSGSDAVSTTRVSTSTNEMVSTLLPSSSSSSASQQPINDSSHSKETNGHGPSSSSAVTTTSSSSSFSNEASIELNNSNSYNNINSNSNSNSNSNKIINNNPYKEFKNKQNKAERTMKVLILKVMLKQESSTYYKQYDYIHSSQPRQILVLPTKIEMNKNNHRDDLLQHHSPRSSSSFNTTITTTTTTTTTTMTTESMALSPTNSRKRQLSDLSCRHKICEWTFRVMNFFNIERETVYFSLSYLDRFMMKYQTDRRTYKLLATTALFLALKVHQPRKLILKNVVQDLSKGEFDMGDIDEMELIMLGTLSWSLHPPTPMMFVYRLMDINKSMISVLNQNMVRTVFLDCGDCESSLFFDINKIQTYAIFFVELSIFDYSLVTENPSKIALAAIVDTIEGLGLFDAMESEDTIQIKHLFYSILSSMFDLVQEDINSELDRHRFSGVRNKLWDLYENSEEIQNSESFCLFRRRDDDQLEIRGWFERHIANLT